LIANGMASEPLDLDGAVIIALGSNLPGAFDSSEALLEAALGRFRDIGLRVLARSVWWRSAAWPDPTAPEYRNGVAIVATALAAGDVMARLLTLERDLGRRRGVRNAPRALDLDLVAFGRETSDVDGLQLPHPRAHERRFVMGPLAEIAPAWRHPVLGERASALATLAQVGKDAAPA
jgi:2-amino-4-hydroxy-6-hydroxymethyldihydropteridine diphosphokinase